MGRDGGPSRRSVLDAAGRVVTERGLEGLRVREVAARARLSTGAVLYHFPDQAELLLAVHADSVERYVEDRRAAVDPGAGAVADLLAVARAGVPPWADEQTIRLLYEMHGLARRSDPHAALLGDLWTAERDLYVQIIGAGVAEGVFAPAEEPGTVAEQLLALEDGLVLHRISRNRNVGSALILTTFASAASSLLACDLLVREAARAPRVEQDGAGERTTAR